MKLTYCLVGFTLLFSSIFMHLIKDNTKFSNFINTLNDKQKKIYKDIILERLKIYSIGIAVGLLLGVFYYLKTSKDKRNICLFLTIVFITKLVVYRVYPKSTMMLYHLTNKAQTDAWTDIYVHMKRNCIISIILGLISYLFLGKGFKNLI
tara:strand:+ start:1168 stop:1617 length:450 start_codon:yes stop_codon:yes gene_type:complete